MEPMGTAASACDFCQGSKASKISWDGKAAALARAVELCKGSVL